MNFKKTFCLLTSACMMACTLNFSSVFAKETKPNETTIYQEYIDESVMDEDIQKQIEDSISEYKKSHSVARIPDYVSYEYVEESPINKTASGYAGNQPAGGTRFATGGSFYWSPNGGPTVNVSLGASYAGVSIAISLGTVSTTGYVCNVPNTKDYFKLKVTRTDRVVPTKVYGKTASGTKEFLYRLYPHTLYSRVLSAVKV